MYGTATVLFSSRQPEQPRPETLESPCANGSTILGLAHESQIDAQADTSRICITAIAVVPPQRGHVPRGNTGILAPTGTTSAVIYRMRVPPKFVFFPWGIPQLQSDWSLSCDHGLDYAS